MCSRIHFDSMDDRMTSHLRFDPYEGIYYRKGFISGFKLLLLGESHYSDSCDRNITKEYISNHIDGKETKPTWRACERLLSSCFPSVGQGADIWRYIAFSNFVQVPMSCRKCRPTEGDWKTGYEAFPELLALLQPDVMLVLGKTMWEDWLPGQEWKWGITDLKQPGIREGSDTNGVIYTREDGGKTVSGFVYHPASYGWCWQDWRSTVEWLFLEAKRVVNA